MLISGASPGAGDLPAASSLMSSRWSRDNLITGHPARLYSGKILARIDEALVEQLVQELETTIGPVGAAGRMGVYTWDIKCRRSSTSRAGAGGRGATCRGSTSRTCGSSARAG